ncbi:hypothetical protein PROFUN_14912 [Planoprotostelium fungivorum]|uniref:Uncharacterized protein n=1 Tax=Planoprotostelium fungivorum TaxID=1890364 RepID=A0A2P6MY36_9EUKA|nr:hypothetical protein PROFUN_14912 [Planoprotostelium fungivorum]
MDRVIESVLSPSISFWRWIPWRAIRRISQICSVKSHNKRESLLLRHMEYGLYFRPAELEDFDLFALGIIHQPLFDIEPFQGDVDPDLFVTKDEIVGPNVAELQCNIHRYQCWNRQLQSTDPEMKKPIFTNAPPNSRCIACVSWTAFKHTETQTYTVVVCPEGTFTLEDKKGSPIKVPKFNTFQHKVQLNGSNPPLIKFGLELKDHEEGQLLGRLEMEMERVTAKPRNHPDRKVRDENYKPKKQKTQE